MLLTFLLCQIRSDSGLNSSFKEDFPTIYSLTYSVLYELPNTCSDRLDHWWPLQILFKEGDPASPDPEPHFFTSMFEINGTR